MLEYKIDVLKALKEAGYNQTRLRRDYILGQKTIDALRHGRPISWDTLELVCELLQKEPGDILHMTKEFRDVKERSDKHQIRV